MRRRTGAIFQVTVPATIMRSAWRGDALKTSEPKRAMSYREVALAIISMAQQARPNMAGQSDEARAQLRMPSTEVTRTFLRTSSSRSTAVCSRCRRRGWGMAMSGWCVVTPAPCGVGVGGGDGIEGWRIGEGGLCSGVVMVGW